MTNVEALKALYVALGNDAADVENANTIVDVLNAIAAKYEGKDDATTNSEGIENITAVLDNIIPEPVPSENNAKFAATPAAFAALSNMESIDIPSGVTAIVTNGLYNFTALKTITIPSSVTSIGSGAFTNCRALETITIDKPEGSITGAPWEAPSTTQIIWNG